MSLRAIGPAARSLIGAVLVGCVGIACEQVLGIGGYHDRTSDGDAEAADSAVPENDAEPSVDATTSGDATTAKDAAGDARTTKCGNGIIETGEQCDDDNPDSGDGCSSTCRIEAGWACPTSGVPCIAAACSDGIIAGAEECEDGNTNSGDGCSATCRLEPGWVCNGTTCTTTTCGDGLKQGLEACDDGNVRPYDGCATNCTIEPSCGKGACDSVCGDGFIESGETCDDGNLISADGCSKKCTVEPGFSCQTVLPASIDIPIVIRDFTPTTSADFETFANGSPTYQLVKGPLGTDKTPDFNSTGSPQQITSATTFAQWYHDVNGVNMTIPTTLTLSHVGLDAGANDYIFSSNLFFPIDNLGFGNYMATGHNYHFTTQIRYWFTYHGGEVFDLTGDDDIWIFVNNKLAIDVGGVHPDYTQSVTIDQIATAVGLVVGNVYEIEAFHAQRHTNASDYKLTTSLIGRAVSVCTAICGDAILTGDEECDDGTAKNTGGYGKCRNDCTRDIRCGDKLVQGAAGEQCDDGNLISGDGCSSTCKTE